MKTAAASNTYYNTDLEFYSFNPLNTKVTLIFTVEVLNFKVPLNTKVTLILYSRGRIV
jgi:hypothetical protein